ncbi:MAG: hypothetical protein AAF710_06655 [Planctomycetota bacterium]
MSRIPTSSSLKALTVAALTLGVCFAATSASAGTQMPHWKKMKLKAQAAAAAYNPAPDPPVHVGGGDPYDGGDNGPTTGDNGSSSYVSGGGQPGQPSAVPAPSAVVGGLALMGLLAGRRRKADA